MSIIHGLFSNLIRINSTAIKLSINNCLEIHFQLNLLEYWKKFKSALDFLKASSSEENVDSFW